MLKIRVNVEQVKTLRHRAAGVVISRDRCAALFAAAAAAIVVACGCRPDTAANDKADSGVLATTFKPTIQANLLVISVDTTRADHLGCYGYDKPTSPNIDALAAAGHRFAQAFTVMPTTLPSHSAMMTSLYPRQMALFGNLGTLSPQAHTLAERLKTSGFATGAFISAVPLAATTGFNQGFDVYECPPKSEWRGDRTRGLAQKWIEQHKAQRFFAFVHFFEPHSPYQPRAESAKLFGLEQRRRLPPAIDFSVGKQNFSADLRTDCNAAYDAEIHDVDAQVGLLLESLKAAGVAEKTIVVLVSDHGETLDELIDSHGYGYDHGEFLHPRELRIPMIVHLPSALKLAATGVHDQQVDTLDLMPTVLELLGVPCTPPYAGRSLVPLFQGGNIAPSTFYAQRHEFDPGTEPNDWMKGDEFAVIQAPWTAIVSDGRGEFLYNVKADSSAPPDERPSAQEQYMRLRRELFLWMDQRRVGEFGQGERNPDQEHKSKVSDVGYLNGQG